MQLFNDFAHILGEWPSGSPEWLAARKIGASSVGHLAAYARWSEDPHAHDVPKYTPWTLYAEMVNPGPREQKYVFDRGNAMEPLLIEWAAKRLGDVTAYKASLAHPDEPWATCNLDGLERNAPGEPWATVEIKDYGLHRAPDFVHGAPQDLVDQVMWQMRCTNLREGYGFVSIGGREPELYPIQWDQGLADWLGELARRFWRYYVEPRIPPPVDYTEACATAILDSWEDSDEEGELCDEGKELAIEYKRAVRAGDAADAHKAEAKAGLLELLARHRKLIEPGEGKVVTKVKVSRVDGRKGIDWSRLMADEANTVEKYRTKIDETALKKGEPKLVKKYTTTVGASYIRVTIPRAPK